MLQIAFSAGVRNQLSEDYREFEQIKRWRVGNTQARELRFMLQTSYGPAAIQYRNPGSSGRAFPTAQQSTTSEYTAKFKEIDATIELEYNLYDRALSSPEKYAEPLALEIQNKTTGSRRRTAADWYGDGTGVVGEAAAGVDDSLINTAGSYSIVVTLEEGDAALGGIGNFEFGDLLLCKQPAGTARTPSGGSSFYAYKVTRKNRKAGTVTLALVDSSGALKSGYTSSGVADGDFFYRVGQPTFADLSTTVSDYGLATEVPAGLESLTAGDGRTVHGITMAGATAGTVLDQSGDPLDARMIQEAMDTVKVNVGQDQYKWAKMCMSPENHAKLINSRETDRRFVEVTDNKRGTRAFAFIHGNDTVEAYTSEFVKKQRILGIPEMKSGKKVLEYYGSDYKPVKMPGQGEFQLKPSADGGHVNMVVSYLHGILVYICKHPASVWTLRNFS